MNCCSLQGTMGAFGRAVLVTAGVLLATASFMYFLFDWNALSLAGVPAVELHMGSLVATAFNLALVLSFGASHTLTATPTYTMFASSVLPKDLVRPLYVLGSGAHLSLVLLLWQPMGGSKYLWRAPLDPTLELVVNMGCSAVGLAFIAIVVASFGSSNFLGLAPPSPAASHAITDSDLASTSQVPQGSTLRRRPASQQPPTRHEGRTTRNSTDLRTSSPELQTTGFYAFSRHPMYTGLAWCLFVTPVMTLDRLVFASGLTMYLFTFGIAMEERKLHALFGPKYRAYQQRVGAVCPLF